MLKIHQARHLDFLLTVSLIFHPHTITQRFIKRLITHHQVANIAFCRGFNHRIHRTFRQLRIKFTHRLTQLLNKDYTAQITTGKLALMNRQIFTVTIFPTEGLQALKGELFDVVFVEHDGFLLCICCLWGANGLISSFIDTAKSPLTPLC